MGLKAAVLIALAIVLSLPFFVRGLAAQDQLGAAADGAKPTLKLVLVTPHVEQIREEFARGFDRWHRRVHGSGVIVDFRAPGGTSEIMKQLEATFEAAARKGFIDDQGRMKAGEAGYDVFFGGGSFEHSKMGTEREAKLSGNRTIKYRLGQPAGFPTATLEELYGENKIGVQQLYDPNQYWLGTALSGFGIVYNKDVLAKLQLPEPKGFDDLTHLGYFNMLALADGRQSGSVTTTYDSILNKEGWTRGWAMLREMCGNARYFASASTRPPIDVGQGEAAAGLAIDFYGRGQAQFLLKPGQDASQGRVGYIDPEGAVYIDADPVSILNGASNVELARRFVEYCLTDEAQAKWQFPALSHATSTNNPTGEDGRKLGPDQYELRRMPVRRSMYAKYLQYFQDKTDPFKAASNVKQRGWRSLIGPMMAAFGIDTASECRAAWFALCHARARSISTGFPEATLKKMEQLFYAMPEHTMRDGTKLLLSEENFAAIRKDTNSWRDLDHGRRSLIAYTAFFRANYKEVIRLGKENGL